MRKVKIKNKLAIPLLAATVIIWGMIIINILDYFSSVTDAATEVIVEDGFDFNPQKRIKVVSADLEFTKLNRDPFLFPRKAPPKQIVSKPKIQAPKVPIINYKIAGVIINDKSKLVILEDYTNHTTEFLHEKESYKDIKIINISASKVLILEAGVKKEVLLNQ